MPPYPKWMNKNELGKILKLWEKDNVLRFGEVHRGLVKLGLVKPNDRKKTVRILRKLIQEGYVEEVSEGYRSALKLKEFDVMEYISKLLKHYGKKNLIYEGRVGGGSWTLAELILIGFPKLDEEKLKKLGEEYPSLMLTMNVLMVRLAKIYEALKELANILREALKGRGVGDFINAFVYRETILKEVLLELIPYYLNLSVRTNDLLKVNELMINALPEKIPEKIRDFTWFNKNTLRMRFEEIKAHAEALKEKMKGSLSLEESDEDESGDFAIIIIPPRELVDEEENFKHLLRYIPFILMKKAEKFPLRFALILWQNYWNQIREEKSVYSKAISVYSKAITALQRLYLLGLIDKVSKMKIEEIIEYCREGSKLLSVMSEYEEMKRHKNLEELKRKLKDIDVGKASIGIWFFYHAVGLDEDVKNMVIAEVIKVVKRVIGGADVNRWRDELEKGYEIAFKSLENIPSNPFIL